MRWWVGPWRISISGPVRPLLLAALLASLRHWQQPTPTLLSATWRWVTSLGRSEALAAVLPAAVGSRALVAAVGLVSVFAFGFPGGRAPFSVSESPLANLYARWDAGWYLNIAHDGYRFDPTYSRQQNVAFFPALPILMRAAAHPLGGEPQALIIAGALVSTVAFTCALAVLYALGRRLPSVRSPERAEFAVVLLAAYPFAVFHGAPCTESLFLLCAVGAFFQAERGAWAAAAAFGFAAGLARPNGFLLAFPLAVVAATAVVRTRPRGWAAIVPFAAATVAPIAGMLAFSAHIAWLTGAWFEWAAITERWGRTFGGPTSVMVFLDHVRTQGWLRWLAEGWPDALNGLAALGTLACVVPITRRLGLAYGVFVVVNVGPPLLFGGVLSIGRLTATMFPLFLWAAGSWRARTIVLTTGASALGQGLMAALFFTWRSPF